MGKWHHFHLFGPVSTSDRMLHFNNEKEMCTMWKDKATHRYVSQRIATKHQEKNACSILYSDCSWYDSHHARLICTMRSVTSNMNNVVCTMLQHTEQIDMLIKIPSAFHTRHDAVVCLRYCIISVCSSEKGHIRRGSRRGWEGGLSSRPSPTPPPPSWVMIWLSAV